MNYQYIKNNSVVKKNKYHLIEENQNVGELLKKMGGTFYKKNNKWSFSKELIDSYCLKEISETIPVSENQHPIVQSESESDQSDQLESESDQSDLENDQSDQLESESDQLDQVESENDQSTVEYDQLESENDQSELENDQSDQSELENDQSDQSELENDHSNQLESENDHSNQLESENENDQSDSELHNNQVDQSTQTENPIMYHHLPSRIFYDIITEYLTTDTVC